MALCAGPTGVTLQPMAEPSFVDKAEDEKR